MAVMILYHCILNTTDYPAAAARLQGAMAACGDVGESAVGSHVPLPVPRCRRGGRHATFAGMLPQSNILPSTSTVVTVVQVR